MHLFILLDWWNGFWRVSPNFFLVLFNETDESVPRNARYVIFQMRSLFVLSRLVERSDKNISMHGQCYNSSCLAYFP
jgi:hypothetical protein